MTYSPNNPRLGPIHNFLVAACEIEQGLPEVRHPGLKTLWPEASVERNVDYMPDRMKVTKNLLSEGSAYPKYRQALKNSYEEALLSIFWTQLSKS